ncbi:hypothetical protein ACHAW5_009563 [Stephanodiscus triporus]|uniref:Solute carrier family 40 protein n=1 Tax=Stephanodiscus triporus TaxID=2934178 RepID=A0ABD3NCU7_9STRA
MTIINDAPLSAMSSALDARISNLRTGGIMSTSSFLINLLLANAAINVLLLLPFALSSLGARRVGPTILLVSFVSCVHATTSVAMILGERVAEYISPSSSSSSSFASSSAPSSSSSRSRLSSALRSASASFDADPYLRGAAFGMTIALAVLMRVVSAHWGAIVDCLDNESPSSSSCVVGAHAGSARAVSFLSGLLSWLDAAMAVSMYRRRESMSMLSSGGNGDGFGVIGLFSSNINRQYDEIGAVDDRMQFAGDFPSGLGSGTTIRV